MSGKVLNPTRWPRADRAAWNAAFDEGDIFDGRGPAAHWAAGSRRSIASGYGRWIGYLTAVEPEALDRPPAERVTRDRLRRYLDHLRGEITPMGVFNYAKHLYDAIRVMAPDRDWRWFKAIVWRLDRRGHSHRNKRSRMVTPGQLIRLGIGLMEQAQPQIEGLNAATRGYDVLRNELYVGQLVWNRQHYVKDPATGKRLARPNPKEQWIIEAVPDLRIIDNDLRREVQDRLSAIRNSPGVKKARACRKNSNSWSSRRPGKRKPSRRL